MIFQNWFAKEISVRLSEQGKNFVSTISYSIRLPKGGAIRFKKTAEFDSGLEAKTVVHRSSLESNQSENIRLDRRIWR